MTTSSLVITGPIFRFCNKKAPHKICIFLFPFISYYILCLYGILLFVTLTLQYNVDVESQVDICVIIIARYIYNNIYTHTHIYTIIRKFLLVLKPKKFIYVFGSFCRKVLRLDIHLCCLATDSFIYTYIQKKYYNILTLFCVIQRFCGKCFPHISIYLSLKLL